MEEHCMLKKIMVALVMLSTTAYTHQLNGMAGRLRAVAARAMHTAQAAWNKVPQPVRKATEVVIQHPLKTSLLVTAADRKSVV